MRLSIEKALMMTPGPVQAGFFATGTVFEIDHPVWREFRDWVILVDEHHTSNPVFWSRASFWM
jgi:hypothetical protein